MLSVKAANKFIDSLIVERLELVIPILTIADLGPKAKQTDVTKVKELIRKRIEKLNAKKETGIRGS